MAEPTRWETLQEASLWRKIAVGMWSRPTSPTFYGMMEVDVTEMLDYLDEVRRVTGHRVTPTVFLVKVLARFFEQNPDLNVIVVGNEVKKRTHIDIFCQVAIPGSDGMQADLSGVKIEDCDQLELPDILASLHKRAGRIRTGDDEQIESTRSTLDLVPARLRPLVVRLVEFLTFEVPLDLGRIGLPSDPFGSAMLSSVGQFDVDQAFAPLVPASRCPLVVLPGRIREAPIAIDGEVQVRKVMTLSSTADHRCYDGFQGGRYIRAMRSMITCPRDYFPNPEVWVES